MKFIKLIFRIAALANILSLFLPWWSHFEIYTRTQKDVFLFGSFSYTVDLPPNVWQFPAEDSEVVFTSLPMEFQLVMCFIVLLLCISALFFVQATLSLENNFNFGKFGFLLTLIGAFSFLIAISSFNAPFGVIGSISKGVISWGPDAGFFLILFSVCLILVGLILTSILLKKQ